MKPGWKTTEFWLSLAAQLVGAAAASGALPGTGTTAQVVGLASAALAAFGYTAGRSSVKKAESQRRPAGQDPAADAADLQAISDLANHRKK
jgi:hypothetical protein